jgi:hypothetical protein
MRLRVLPLILLGSLGVALGLGVSGCTALREHLPWRHQSPPPPVPVRELQVVVSGDAQVPIVLQFWERNTLVVDLTGVAAKGSVEVRPGESGHWPVRLALRFQPGRFEAVEVRGAQRNVFPVTDDRNGAATVELPPNVHPTETTSLRLSWGARSDF